MVMYAILDVFYRQMTRCQSMSAAIEKYNWDIQPICKIHECYAWLISAVQKNLNRDRDLHNRHEWDLERNSRITLQTGVGVPGGALALQDTRVPAAAGAMPTCYRTRAGKICKKVGCQFDHTPVQQPAQQQAGPPRMTELQQAQAEALHLKQMLATAHTRATQMIGQPILLDAAPAPAAQAPIAPGGAQAEQRQQAPGPMAPVDPWARAAAAAANDNARQGRDLTPGPSARVRATSNASASPGGGDKSFPGGPCYAASRGVCLGPNKTPFPCTRCKVAGPQTPLNVSEMLKRDRWETSLDKQGKPVPYFRSDVQIQQALANVEANKHLVNDHKGKGSANGKGKGKGPMICFKCGEAGHMARECPSQPQQGANGEKGKGKRAGPGKGGPNDWGEPGSDPRPCHTFQAGYCRFGATCTMQHVQ